MIYSIPDETISLAQGDILDDCPVLVWSPSDAAATLEPGEARSRVIVITQSCDLAQTKVSRVVVASVHDAQDLVASGVLKEQTVRDQVRTHRVYGWYFLPAGPRLTESIVNLRDLYTVPRDTIELLITEGNRVCRLVTPYREHMAQHFSTTYSRIGLPAPYGTEANHG